MDSTGNAHPDTFRIPSHADMHQQIRAVRNFMGESGSKPAGIWLWGWGRNDGQPGANAMAAVRWTQENTEKWAEAVQNEIDNPTEGTGGAIPPDSTVLQSLPPSFPPYNRSTKLGGAWITFRLHQRGLVEFTIKQGAVEKRRLHWEYNYNSVQQNAVNTVSCPPGQVDKLGAVAIFFDGRDNAGNNLPAGSYTCQMMVNGATVGCVIGLTIE